MIKNILKIIYVVSNGEIYADDKLTLLLSCCVYLFSINYTIKYKCLWPINKYVEIFANGK